MNQYQPWPCWSTIESFFTPKTFGREEDFCASGQYPYFNPKKHGLFGSSKAWGYGIKTKQFLIYNIAIFSSKSTKHSIKWKLTSLAICRMFDHFSLWKTRSHQNWTRKSWKINVCKFLVTNHIFYVKFLPGMCLAFIWCTYCLFRWKITNFQKLLYHKLAIKLGYFYVPLHCGYEGYKNSKWKSLKIAKFILFVFLHTL